jgi:hypothetical protein
MARTVEQIQTEIKTQVRTYTSLDAFKFPEEGGSKYGTFNLIIFIVATAMFTLETMIDLLKADIEEAAEKAISGNSKWLQAQILNFQFGDVIQLVDFVPTYPVLDESKKIITRCSVKPAASGIVAIKVAKGAVGALGPLTAPELTALQDYYYGTATTQGIGFAGVKASFINLEADRMRVQGKVHFYGQYVEATVKAAVIAAIENFFNTFQDTAFDGTVFMIKLVDAVQAVPGVSRFVLEAVSARPQTGTLATVDIQGFYTTVAGYVIAEDAAGNTLTDTITMQVESV